MAKTLYGAHLLKKAHNPDIYLDRIIQYYERALELLPDEEQEISKTLMSIYASLGDREKASGYFEKLQGTILERMEHHYDMLFILRDYPAAAEELKGLVLRKVVALSTDLGLLHDILVACNNIVVVFAISFYTYLVSKMGDHDRLLEKYKDRSYIDAENAELKRIRDDSKKPKPVTNEQGEVLKL